MSVSESFFPGSADYEQLVSPVRGDDLDVYGLIEPFGVVSEQAILGSPELHHVSQLNERASYREALVRTRAWLDMVAPKYTRIVVVPFGESAQIWTTALQGPRRGKRKTVVVAERIVTVPVHRSTGLRGRILSNRLKNALRR